MTHGLMEDPFIIETHGLSMEWAIVGIRGWATNQYTAMHTWATCRPTL